MEQQFDDEIEIDLKGLFFAILQEWRYIVLSAVLVGGITALINIFFLVPQYASTSKLYILTKSTSLTSLADLQVGTNLTQDYMVVIKSRPVVEEVSRNLKLEMEYEALIGKIAVENPTNTRILNITATDADPKVAKQIADEFAEVSAEYIAEKMDQDPPNIIEKGFVSENPISPAKKRNVFMGILLGGFLVVAFVTVGFIMDDTIKTEEDIENCLQLHTLAIVPESERLTTNNWKANDKK